MNNDPNNFIDSLKFKINNLLIQKNLSKSTGNDSYNHGFSYVAIFKIINILASILVFIFSFMIESALLGTDFQPIGIQLILNILLAFISYWMLTLPIKLFENIAIIAKNSTDIRNKLNEQ